MVENDVRSLKFRATDLAGRNSAPLARIRTIIGQVELDCRCRVSLDDALDRFAALEMARLQRGVLRDARQAKSAIASLLKLLADLDEVTDMEADRSVFGELALLFESIGDEAKAAAGLMRRLEEM